MAEARSVVITGGLGFLGRQVARALLRQHAGRAAADSAPLHVKLVDVGSTSTADEDESLARAILEDATEGRGGGDDGLASGVEIIRGDISDAEFCRGVVGDDTASVFHLAAVMSGQGEADFDSAIQVNLHGTLNLLEAVRGSGSSGAKFLFASTGAVFDQRAVDRPSRTRRSSFRVTLRHDQVLL